MRTARILTRFVAIAGSAAAVVGPVSPASAEAAPTTCEVHELPMPPGTDTGSVTGASPDGRTLLGYASSGGSQQGDKVVFWRDGTIVDTIEEPLGELDDVNADGVAVGGYFGEHTEARPYVYADGQTHVLPGDVAPIAINDAGRIVGYRSVAENSSESVPVTWAPGQDHAVDLPPGPLGVAEDISEDGTTVGQTSNGTTQDAYVWHPDGTHEALPRPEGTSPEERLSAYSISGPWVIGFGTQGALRWNLDTGAAEHIHELTTDGHTAINERGWFVGQRAGESSAAMFADGEIIALPDSDSGDVHYAQSLSTDGTVIGGTAVFTRGASTPIYWTCS